MRVYICVYVCIYLGAYMRMRSICPRYFGLCGRLATNARSI